MFLEYYKHIICVTSPALHSDPLRLLLHVTDGETESHRGLTIYSDSVLEMGGGPAYLTPRSTLITTVHFTSLTSSQTSLLLPAVDRLNLSLLS